MGLFNWAKKKAASIPVLFSANRGRTGASAATNYEYYASWVFASVRAISEEVASINLRLERHDSNGNRERVTKHPALSVLESVNDFMDFYTLIERLQSNLELAGNEYWYLELNSKGVPIEIYPLAPNSITPVADPTNYISHYQYKLGSSVIDIPKENILQFKNFNPKSDILGFSTLAAARTAADTDFAAREYNKNTFLNDATPGVIITVPDALDPEAQQKIIEAWNQDHGSYKKAFKTAVMTGGMDVKTLAMNHKDMEFIEQRRFSRDEILAIFRVPKTIIGILEDANFASAKTANYVFALRTVRPKMKRIVNTLNEFFLPLFGDENLKFDFDDPVPEDKQEQMAWYSSALTSGWMSINEVRRKENLPPVENGDAVMVSYSAVPLGEPIDEPQKVFEGPAAKLSKAIAGELVGLFATKSEAKEPEPVKELAKDQEVKGELKAKARNARLDPYEKLIKKTSETLFAGQKERAKEALKKELNAKNWRARKAKMQLLDPEKEIKATIDLFTPVFQEVLKGEGDAAFEFLGINDEFDLTSARARKFLEKNTKKFAGGITEETSRQIRASVAAGLDAGEAIPDLMERIDDLAGFGSVRAEMIARTESIRAATAAEKEAWEESEVVAKVIWYTALDERVCENCGPMHGTEIDIADNFFAKGDTAPGGLLLDYEAVGGPPMHPDCRCTLLPVVDDTKSYKPRIEKLSLSDKLAIYHHELEKESD